MPLHPRPLAVGLLHLPSDVTPAERRKARIALALTVALEGYALIETFETVGSDIQQMDALLALEEVARRHDANALVYSGDVNLERAREVAERVRMVVVGSQR